MWTAVVTAGAKVVSVLASFGNMLLKAIGYIGIYLAAKRKVKGDVLEDVAKVKDRQLEIASRPAMHRDTLLERMRKRKRS